MTNPIKEEAGVFPDKTRLPAFRNVNSAASAVVGTGETTVTGTLVDEGGQVWKGAIVLINFFPTPNIPGPYMWQGGPFSLAPRLTADSSGFFSITIPDNTTITPAGSMWQFVIAPNATMPAVVFNLQISGTTQDISTVFTSQSYQVSLGTVQSLPLPRAYRDSEVATPPNTGQIYFNTDEQQVRIWQNGALTNYTGRWSALLSANFIVLPNGIDLSAVQGSGFYACDSGVTGIPAGMPDTHVSLTLLGGIRFVTSEDDPSSKIYYSTWSAVPGGWIDPWFLITATQV